MQATEDQIAILNKLQEVDRLGLRAQKALKQLSQPAEGVAVRKKRDEVAAKLAKIDALYNKESANLEKLELEDQQLSEKIRNVQEKINTAEGNYRGVETWTRDMQIMDDRRDLLSDQMTESLTKISEIERVKTQAESVVSQLEEKERKLYEEFQHESGLLKEEIQRCQDAGRAFASKLPADLLKKYLDAVRSCGGVGVSHLINDSCSACRNVIPANKMPLVRSQAPIAECPNCHRLLIIG